jgi:hypothetical protein
MDKLSTYLHYIAISLLPMYHPPIKALVSVDRRASPIIAEFLDYVKETSGEESIPAGTLLRHVSEMINAALKRVSRLTVFLCSQN